MATHWEVAHNWAHQTGKAQNGHSMSYRHETLYSYQTAVARLIDPGHGAGMVALISQNHWGHSSGSHISKARQATDHLTQFFVRTPDPDHHDRNYQGYVQDIIEALGKAGRAVKYGRYSIERAALLLDEMNRYSHTFLLGHGTKSLSDIVPAFPAIQARVDRLADKHDEAKRLSDIRTKLVNRDVIRAWLRGENVRAPHTLRPMVRVQGDKLQTSWGVTIPLNTALELYVLAKQARSGNPTQPQPLDVPPYGPARIDAQGTIRVGCHTIPFRYAHHAACYAGLEGATIDRMDDPAPIELQR